MGSLYKIITLLASWKSFSGEMYDWTGLGGVGERSTLAYAYY